MLGEISDGGNSHHRMAVEDMIQQKNIPIHFNTKAVRITDKGVAGVPIGVAAGVSEVFFEADTVVLAVGMRPRQEEAAPVQRLRAPTFHMLGECRRVANIIVATGTAFTTAKYIGRYDPV